MPATTNDIRQILLETNPEYRRLAEEHLRCESQLEQLVTQTYWKQEDLEQEIRLKKTKLHLKDRMEMIVITQYRTLPH
ncbi:MAG: hypothetical protein WA823_01215 [Candidatus Acidiferrales bacterium]